jgi:hypothetical protein
VNASEFEVPRAAAGKFTIASLTMQGRGELELAIEV